VIRDFSPVTPWAEFFRHPGVSLRFSELYTIAFLSGPHRERPILSEDGLL